MKKVLFTSMALHLVIFSITACSDNKAAKTKAEPIIISQKKAAGLVKEDEPAIGTIETDTYIMKLHRAFNYDAKGSDVLAGFKPKEGHKFVYLDVSLRNKSPEKLDGGFLFIALKVTDTAGAEYKKPAAGLAAYITEHPEDSNPNEYNALWETFAPNEFHRDIIYCVEVPSTEKHFVLHMPINRNKKDWKTIEFSVE